MRILLFIFLFSSALYASERDYAYDRICRSLDFESSRRNCTDAIERYDYFSSDAVSICARLTFESDKISCINAIGNHDYARYEIEECSRSDFDSSVLSCLRSRGQTAYRSAPPVYVPTPIPVPVPVHYYYPHYWHHRPYYYPGLNIHIKL